MAATVRASNEDLDRIDKARCKKGWAKTSQAWVDLANTSKATLRRFWAGLNIQTSAFQAICEAVGIENWESVVDFDSTDDSPPKTYSKRLGFAIAGSIEEIDRQKLDAIVALLRKLGGDTEIEILDIEEGSIKLILGGSPESLERLQELFQSGQLEEVEGLAVQDVHLINTEETIESPKSNVALRRSTEVNLRRGDFHSLDLRDTVFTNADLRGANFIDADLHQADFRDTRLHKTTLDGVDLSKVKLFGANFFEAALCEANLNRTDLRGVNFYGADLRGANLSEANLVVVNLYGTDLREANLYGANLYGANLYGANLHGTIISEARFIQTKGVSSKERINFVERGAIFEDDLSFPDRTLVSR